jgi:hypothetical protein
MSSIFDPNSLRKAIPEKMYSLALLMRSVEHWVSDAPELRTALDDLANLFRVEPDSAGVHFSGDSLLVWTRALAYIDTCAALALLRILGQAQPGLGGDLLLRCAEHDQPGDPLEAEARVMLARIAKLVRLEIYERVFGPDRRKLVLEILEELR